MKSIKRVFCLVLALLMLTTTGILSAVAEGTQEACPHIYVNGFMGAPLLEDKDDPNSKVIWPPDTNAILADVKEALPTLVSALLVNNWETFGTVVIDLVKPYFEPTYLADNGTCTNTSGVYFRYPDANSIPKNGRVDFLYDWRLNPLETAEDLNKFIDYVMTSTGASKINISCHSLGGIIVLSYLTKYGYDKVRSICFNTTAIFGESYTGDLMRGDIVFDADSIDYYMRYVLEGTEYDVLFTELISMLNQAHLLDLLAKKANGLTASQKERVCREVLLPMFGNWLTIWSMVPDKDVEASQDIVFNQLCAGKDYSELRGKIDAYNNTVRAHRDELLTALNTSKNLYVISRYGYSSVPVTSSFATLSDGVVDTQYSSFGATTSNYDKKLTKAQINSVDAAYISPDQRIDASSCMFPEQTWFIRNLKHSVHPNSVWALVEQLLAQDEQATVSTFQQYPRFLSFDAAADTLTPDEAKAENGATKALSILDRLKAFFEQLKQLLSKIPAFSSLFNK